MHKQINYSLRKVIRHIIITESKTQDRRLRSFTNKITKAVMKLYRGGSSPAASKISISDLTQQPTFRQADIYEIEAGYFPLAFDPTTMDPTEYEDTDDLDTFLTVVVEIKKAGKKFNVSASDKSMTGMSDFGIHLAIETPPGFSKKKYGDLRNEIANSIRHELEHITQGAVTDQPAGSFARGEEYWSFLAGPGDVTSPYAKYLLKPEEIPAHVRGYSQNVKNLVSLKSSFDTLLSNYVTRKLLSPDEAEIVTATWVAWAEKHIHKKGF